MDTKKRDLLKLKYQLIGNKINNCTYKLQYKQLKRELKNTEKELFKCQKIIYKECKSKGHEFGEWVDEGWEEKREYYGVYDIYPPYVKLIHPLFKRK